MQQWIVRSSFLLVCSLLAACNDSSSSSSPSSVPATDSAAPQLIPLDQQLAACTRDNPALIPPDSTQGTAPDGYVADVSGDFALDLAGEGITVAAPAGQCADNQDFRFGTGIGDITGVIANTGGMGWEDPEQVLSGIHQRQYARAYAIESPCNGKRVLFVSTDTGMIFGSVRQGVLAEIAADTALSQRYGADNLMLSATHTHSGPAGYSHHEAFNLFHFGFDQESLDVIVRGVVDAIRKADANLQANPEPAPISLASGELLNTNINRSLPAFERNPESERLEFVDGAGQPVEVDKRAVQLNFVRKNDRAVGLINWFGVHPTVIGSYEQYVSPDNKGFASLLLERMLGTDYAAAAGNDTFVAAFAQTDEGDASPNIFIKQLPHPNPSRGGGEDDFDSAAISGLKQAAKALELGANGRILRGGVDYRFFHVKMDEVIVETYEGPALPAAWDSDDKRTCDPALGVSFGAGAEDGPGVTAEGASCEDPDAAQAAADDFVAGSDGKIPPNLLATTVLCNVGQLPGADLSCHAEKPILFAIGEPLNAEPSILPFQLFRIGNLAILGVPFEVTTMAARRLQKTLLKVLAQDGVDTLVVAGLVNDYVHYLTTREEYSAQQYEGASTIFGAWQLAAVQQESKKLATAMVAGVAVDSGPAYVDGTPVVTRSPYSPSDDNGGGAYGDVITDVAPSVARGQSVTAVFQAGHPRNVTIAGSVLPFAVVEQKQSDGSWQVVRDDNAPELFFTWRSDSQQAGNPNDAPVTGPSEGEVRWEVPLDSAPGMYRLRHNGIAKESASADEIPYSGVSSTFVISGPAQNCASVTPYSAP